MARKTVDLYTDGACSGNPGPGGWCAILRYGEHEKVLSGFMQHTTNNRMEIYAVIAGLKALNTACDVNVYSDSAYLVNAFTKGWITRWQANDWKTAAKEPVENQDLWRQLLIVMQRHRVFWHKVQGHSGHELNNRCDKIAVGEIAKFRALSETSAEASNNQDAPAEQKN